MPEWTFIVVQIAFWMALSTWFGAVLFVVLAPPIILRAVRQNNPVLPTVLSVNLEGQHGTLLAGSIIAVSKGWAGGGWSALAGLDQRCRYYI